jgi:hypothetical protein
LPVEEEKKSKKSKKNRKTSTLASSLFFSSSLSSSSSSFLGALALANARPSYVMTPDNCCQIGTGSDQFALSVTIAFAKDVADIVITKNKPKISPQEEKEVGRIPAERFISGLPGARVRVGGPVLLLLRAAGVHGDH